MKLLLSLLPMTAHQSPLSTSPASLSPSTFHQASSCISPLAALLSNNSTSSTMTHPSILYLFPVSLNPLHSAAKCPTIYSTAPHRKQFSASPENLLIYLSFRVLVRHRSVSTDPSTFVYIPSSPIPAIFIYTRNVVLQSKSSLHIYRLPTIYHVVQVQLSYILQSIKTKLHLSHIFSQLPHLPPRFTFPYSFSQILPSITHC